MRLKNSSNDAREMNVALKQARFTERLIEANQLALNGFESWLFCSGMQYGSPDKWWGDHGKRDFPHEGIDICLYRDRTQQMRRLEEHTRIPVAHDGVVRAMFNDYLGQAVIVEHESAVIGPKRFLSVYAHTTPLKGIRIGKTLNKGDIIATIADTRHSKANIIPHLHLTLALPAPDLSYEPFVWNIMRDPDKVTLLNPIGIIDRTYHVLDSGDLGCLEL